MDENTPKIEIVLTEGDILIDLDRTYFQVEEGEVFVYRDGTHSGYSNLVEVDQEAVIYASGAGRQIFSLSDDI